MRDIKAGDLVMQIRTCCPNGAIKTIGVPFVVEYIKKSALPVYCKVCGFESTEDRVHFPDKSDGFWKPVSWLKKIPPLSEAESAGEREAVKVMR